MQQEIKNEISSMIQIDNNIIAAYYYGSTVYGTTNENSDIDMIVVVNDKKDIQTTQKLEHFGDVNIFSKQEFTDLINTHEITALECLFLDSQFIIKQEENWTFNLSLPQLRSALSGKASNSWVKAKKKFIVEEDRNEYIGKKSAWHAIRILDFGQQIGDKGRIYDYQRTNAMLKNILECKSWEDLDKNFRKIYNEASTQFKLVAPKEVKTNQKMKI